MRLFAAEGAKVSPPTCSPSRARRWPPSSATTSRSSVTTWPTSQSWEAAVNTAARALRRLDVLVNNAGIGHTARIANHTLADYERVIAVNQIGVFLGIRSVIAPMIAAGGGSIVNMSSGAGLRATKYMIAYAASKYAVTGMTAAAALELARDKIRVNSIHPGVIDTPMLGDIRRHQRRHRSCGRRRCGGWARRRRSPTWRCSSPPTSRRT